MYIDPYKARKRTRRRTRFVSDEMFEREAEFQIERFMQDMDMLEFPGPKLFWSKPEE